MHLNISVGQTGIFSYLSKVDNLDIFDSFLHQTTPKCSLQTNRNVKFTQTKKH